MTENTTLTNETTNKITISTRINQLFINISMLNSIWRMGFDIVVIVVFLYSLGKEWLLNNCKDVQVSRFGILRMKTLLIVMKNLCAYFITFYNRTILVGLVQSYI